MNRLFACSIIVAALAAPALTHSADAPPGTHWEYVRPGGYFNRYPVADYCAERRDDRLPSGDPRRFVRVCISTVSGLRKVFGPTFIGGLVEIEGFGRVHTFRYNEEKGPAAEFHVLGTPAYERRVSNALSKAKVVTINGVALAVGSEQPWFSHSARPHVTEYRGHR